MRPPSSPCPAQRDNPTSIPDMEDALNCSIDFERGLVVDARQASLSISETADLLGLSHTTVSGVNREWSKKGKPSSEWQFCWQKCLVDAKGQRRNGQSGSS
uniref:Uncharacterized protein n=1 Tax=Denticeps clupeoides TaxID=299321 RepID=A0AAY4AU25_9TELE